MDSKTSTQVSASTCLDALHVMNRHLATIKGRVEIILLAGCPEYIKSDLITVSNAEREISLIARSLTMVLTQNINQLQEENSL